MKTPSQLSHGEYITKLEITEDKLTLIIGYDTKLIFTLHGDCCSKSFFTPESMTEAKALEYAKFYGYEVRKEVKATTNEMNEDGYKSISIEYNALVIITSGGHTTLDWRNSSNGYYSGDVIVTLENEE